jgi:hypothetical protein
MATKLYQMIIRISIKVEADDAQEARRVASAIAREALEPIVPPVGMTIEKPNACPINLI